MANIYLTRLEQRFQELYGSESLQSSFLFFSPGRVNLIGEHTDYNGGYVLPCAISLGTWALAAPSASRRVRMHSLNYDDHELITLDIAPNYSADYDWGNYPVGVLQMLQNHGFNLPIGLDILFCGDLPDGAGLSSSASIEVLTAVICSSMFGFELDRVKMALICQEAENSFVGMNCGIMDQFTISLGRCGSAMLLDCNTLEYRYLPLDLEGHSIVISNTNKPHKLRESAYNDRRAECEAALDELRKAREIESLGSLSAREFAELEHLITDPINRRRARHAVLENCRTILAAEALENKELVEFGKLMNQSHVSLRDDYDVTGIELDTLAELAWAQPGVLGSRMTGAGFGGCTVSIVKDSAIKTFMADISQAYERIIGYPPNFYVAQTSDGAEQIEGDFS